MKPAFDATDLGASAAPPWKAFWWTCVLAAPPIAIAAAAAGAGISWQDPLRDVAVLCLAAIAEEIVFRGAIQPGLARALAARDRLWPWLTMSNVVTSIAFALAHLWRHPPWIALAVFPVSLVLGVAREGTGRVWPAAALHLYFNLLLYGATRIVG